MNKQTANKILFGLVGALISGVLLGYLMLIYGANNGCFFFNNGYETCGPLGIFIGAIIGAILGLALYKKFR